MLSPDLIYSVKLEWWITGTQLWSIPHGSVCKLRPTLIWAYRSYLFMYSYVKVCWTMHKWNFVDELELYVTEKQRVPSKILKSSTILAVYKILYLVFSLTKSLKIGSPRTNCEYRKSVHLRISNKEYYGLTIIRFLMTFLVMSSYELIRKQEMVLRYRQNVRNENTSKTAWS